VILHPVCTVDCDDPGVRGFLIGTPICAVAGGIVGMAPYGIQTSTRATTTDPWSAPTNVTTLNSEATEGRPSLSFDGQSIYFMSSRTGGFRGNRHL
jgi:WD40-like Beta Propeller Repeat